jgi:hypothetical protein
VAPPAEKCCRPPIRSVRLWRFLLYQSTHWRSVSSILTATFCSWHFLRNSYNPLPPFKISLPESSYLGALYFPPPLLLLSEFSSECNFIWKSCNPLVHLFHYASSHTTPLRCSYLHVLIYLSVVWCIATRLVFFKPVSNHNLRIHKSLITLPFLPIT